MNNLIRYLLLLILIPQTAFGEQTDPFFAPKNTVLTQDSWVFSPEKAKEVRNKLIDLDTNIKLNESLTRSLSLEKESSKFQEDKIKIIMDQNDRLAKSLADERTLSNWERFGFLVLGVATTVLAGYAIKKAGQ